MGLYKNSKNIESFLPLQVNDPFLFKKPANF